jgi:glycerol dehydrogenase
MYAGALAAMAKWVEISHRRETAESIIGAVLLAKAVAEHVYTRLSCLLTMSIMQDSNDVNCEIVFLSIFGAALVSGIARCEQQSAIGHAFYEWTTRYYASSVENVLHGEIVGVGLLIQSWYNRNDEMRQQISRLLTALHMPVSLPNLGITDESAYAGFAKWLCSNKELVPDLSEDELYGFMIKEMR